MWDTVMKPTFLLPRRSTQARAPTPAHSAGDALRSWATSTRISASTAVPPLTAASSVAAASATWAPTKATAARPGTSVPSRGVTTHPRLATCCGRAGTVSGTAAAAPPPSIRTIRLARTSRQPASSEGRLMPRVGQTSTLTLGQFCVVQVREVEGVCSLSMGLILGCVFGVKHHPSLSLSLLKVDISMPFFSFFFFFPITRYLPAIICFTFFWSALRRVEL